MTNLLKQEVTTEGAMQRANKEGAWLPLFPIEHRNLKSFNILHPNLILDNKFILPVSTSYKNPPFLSLEYPDLERVERHQIPDVDFLLLSETDNATARLSYRALIFVMVLSCEWSEEYDVIGILQVAKGDVWSVRYHQREKSVILTVPQRFHCPVEE